jgi:hypothetical protein
MRSDLMTFAGYWSPTTPNPDADSAGDDQSGDGGGEDTA